MIAAAHNQLLQRDVFWPLWVPFVRRDTHNSLVTDYRSLYTWWTGGCPAWRLACRRHRQVYNALWLIIVTACSYLVLNVASKRISGFISDVSEEVATQIAKNCRRRQPHCHLTPPPKGTPANIPINLIFPETRFIGLHFCRW